MRVTRQRQKGTTGALATLIASRYWRAADAERVLEMWRRSGQSAAPTNGWPPSPTRCAPRAPSTASPATPTTWSSRANPTDGGSSPSLGLDKRRRLRRRSTRHAVRDPGGGNGFEPPGSHGSENRHNYGDGVRGDALRIQTCPAGGRHSR